MDDSGTTIAIRPIAGIAEYRACQELQRRAWGITEDGYVVPVATMVSVQHAGGLVLGAFTCDDAAERLVGFTFGYLGRVRGRWALYSQLAAVDESLRDLGLGGRLKQTQRDWARRQGLDLVAWTFDPLQAGNAYFNLHKLGAVCHSYYVNFYGDRPDALNAGLDTDRLLAEWPVDETQPCWLGDHGGDPFDGIRHTQTRHGTVVRLAWDANDLGSSARPVRIEIPADIAALRDKDPELARNWQQAVREAFDWTFRMGYVAIDVIREQSENGRRIFYLLKRSGEGPDQ